MKSIFKRIISCLIVIVSLFAIVSVNQVINAEEVKGTATYSITSTTAVSVSGAPTGSKATYKSTYNTKQQLTSGNSMTLTLTGYDDYCITGITLSMKSNTSKGAGNFSLTAGSTTLSSISTSKFNTSSWAGKWSTSFIDVKPAINDADYVVKSGESVVVKIAATENSLYCQSIKIDYEKKSISPVESFSSNLPSASLNLSWNIQESNTEQYFEKVTSVPASWDGEYIIVSDQSKVAFNGSLTTLDNSNNYIAVTYDATTKNVEYNPNLLNCTFTINSSGHILSKSGYYIGQNTDANALSSSTSTKYTNKISFNNDGTVNIVGSGGAYLRYNATSGQDRFRYYKSSSYTNQQAISLYKFVGSYDEYTITKANVRFGATLEEEFYNNLITGATNVEFGVIVAKAKDLNSTTLVSEYEKGNTAVKYHTFTKEEVVSNGFSFYVVVTNIPEEFYGEDFVTTCFINIDGINYYMKERTTSFIEILYQYTQMAVSDDFTQDVKDVLDVLYNAYN